MPASSNLLPASNRLRPAFNRASWSKRIRPSRERPEPKSFLRLAETGSAIASEFGAQLTPAQSPTQDPDAWRREVADRLSHFGRGGGLESRAIPRCN